MSRSLQLFTSLPLLFMLLAPAPVDAQQAGECCKSSVQTQAVAGLKPGELVRVGLATGDEVRGRVYSFDGSRLVLEDRGCYEWRMLGVQLRDIKQIKRGRGVWGSVRHGFSKTACVLATPVAEFVVAYQMAKYFNEAP